MEFELVTCLVGDKYNEQDNERLRPDRTYRGEILKLPGVWNKLAMLLQPGPCFYVDLDSVLRRPIRTWHGRGRGLTVGRDYWEKWPSKFDLDTVYNSSVMAWVDPQTEIWDRFMASPDLFMRKYKGIDRFLYWECRDLVSFFEDGLYEVHGRERTDNPPILTFSGTSDKSRVHRGTMAD